MSAKVRPQSVVGTCLLTGSRSARLWDVAKGNTEVRRFGAILSLLSPSLSTADSWSPAAGTRRGCGTWRRVKKSASWRDMLTKSLLSPSLPTAGSCSPAAGTTPRGCGTRSPAGNFANSSAFATAGSSSIPMDGTTATALRKSKSSADSPCGARLHWPKQGSKSGPHTDFAALSSRCGEIVPNPRRERRIIGLTRGP